MWEHRTVSNKEYQTTGRINPSETYVRLMDEVEETYSERLFEQDSSEEEDFEIPAFLRKQKF